jgi:predicted ester cyclase
VFGGMCFVHMKDGKIGAAWNNFDFTSMRQQLA